MYKQGKITKKEYEELSDFNKNGYAIVSNDNLYGVIDSKGKEIIDEKYEEWRLFQLCFLLMFIPSIVLKDETISNELIKTLFLKVSIMTINYTNFFILYT